MRIDKLILENFRGFKHFEIKLNSEFNLIVGANGSGKTAILEGLNVAMGSFFLGIRDVDSRHIQKNDIHIHSDNNQREEFQFPVVVRAIGIVDEKEIVWTRTLNGSKNRTTSIEAESIKHISKSLEKKVRDFESVNLPLLAFYSTGRLFDEARSSKKESKSQIASRFRAYERCLEAKSTYTQFIEWFEGKERSFIQKREEDISLKLVRHVLKSNIPNCANIFFEFDPDKQTGLQVQLIDGRTLPFYYLSDGTRNFFAIVADLAYKCTILNPHLNEKSIEETTGIVLIDELDLHLHPEWQREIIHVLKKTFPKIQFICSTHSPFLIQETSDDQLIILENNRVKSAGKGNNMSIEDIAEEIQDVENPQWSKSRQKMFAVARRYYQALKEGKDTSEMKAELDEAMKPFALDTAFYAIVEQEKIIQEYKKNKQ